MGRRVSEEALSFQEQQIQNYLPADHDYWPMTYIGRSGMMQDTRYQVDPASNRKLTGDMSVLSHAGSVV